MEQNNFEAPGRGRVQMLGPGVSQTLTLVTGPEVIHLGERILSLRKSSEKRYGHDMA